MNLLLDTHAFIWYVEGSTLLSVEAKNAIEYPENQCFVSIATLWEMSIKIGLGKLSIKSSFESVQQDLEENNFRLLPISFDHILCNTELPWHHRDPFDRLLIAQTITEEMLLISRDENLDPYFYRQVPRDKIYDFSRREKFESRRLW